MRLSLFLPQNENKCFLFLFSFLIICKKKYKRLTFGGWPIFLQPISSKHNVVRLSRLHRYWYNKYTESLFLMFLPLQPKLSLLCPFIIANSSFSISLGRRIFYSESIFLNMRKNGCFPEHLNLNLFKAKVNHLNIDHILMNSFMYFHPLHSYQKPHSVTVYFKSLLGLLLGEFGRKKKHNNFMKVILARTYEKMANF